MQEQAIISIILLFTSSLFCGLLLFFSLKEIGRHKYRSLIILLTVLTIWYGLIGLTKMRWEGLIPWQPYMPLWRQTLSSQPLLLGLVRPGLILLFAAIAHCYIIATQNQPQALNLRGMRAYWLYLYSLLIIVLTRRNYWLNRESLALVVALMGLLPPLLIMFISYRHLSKSSLRQKSTTSVHRLSWPISFAISLLLIIRVFYAMVSGSRENLYDSYAMISVLPLVFWLIYYHSPYLFLDALVKRGLQAILFAFCFGLYYGTLSYLLGIFAPYTLSFHFIFATMLSLPLGWLTGLRTPLERFIDLHLFGRAHFQDLLVMLNSSLNVATRSEEAIAIACQQIEQGLAAMRVEYLANSDGIDNLRMVGEVNGESLQFNVMANGTCWGYLYIAAPLRRRRYLSEDIKFARLVADSLATTLARLQLQAEREAQQVREWELVNTATQLQLKSLQAQLDPHFLFNSMSLIGSLVLSAPEKARAAVQHLSKVYRYVLDSSRRDLVSVMEEIAFLRAYLEIEQMRFETRLQTRFELCEGLQQLMLPPMLLQPLVENAIKHGLSQKIEGGELYIGVEKKGEELCFTIADTGVGFDTRLTKTTGIGLSNVRQQLSLRYDVELKIDSVPQRGTTIQFSLPLMTMDKLNREESIHAHSHRR